MRILLVTTVLCGCVDAPRAPTATSTQEAQVVPWKQPAKWPYQVESPRVIVHYQATGDLATANTVLADVEYAWSKQITQQGARAPIDNIGPDGRYDVWLQRGIDTLYVSSTGTNPATTYDDAFTSMVLDPWGQYGGSEMRANVFHEFRHGTQGADDWYEHIWFFEAEATMWETAEFGYARLPDVWADVQAHPEWTPFRDDNYTTWFMYGGAAFLLHLRDTVFGGSLAWSNAAWAACRNPSGANEPDFYDALNAQLAPHGTNVFSQLVAFARARTYNVELPAVAKSTHVRASGANRTTFVAGPQMLGTVYTVVQRAPTDNTTIRVSIASTDATGRAVVQVVGQGAADRVLDLTAGPALVAYANNAVTLAVTVLPANNTFDPDSVGTKAVKATIALDK